MLVGIVVIANGSDDRVQGLGLHIQHFQLMLRIVALYAFPGFLHSLNPFKAQETAVGQTDQLPAGRKHADSRIQQDIEIRFRNIARDVGHSFKDPLIRVFDARNHHRYLIRQSLRSGDTLVIKELDRLSRSKSDIKQELEYFKNHGVHIRILDIPTTLTDFPPEQMWVMDMINAILIEVLGSIAENERLKIRRRQREGIDAAKKKDIKFGRPTLELPENWEIVMQAVEAKQITVSQAIGQLHISRSSYYRLKQHQ